VGAGEVLVRRPGRTEVIPGSIFDYLSAQPRLPVAAAADLPFDFRCGFAGYLGYELKAECEGAVAHRAPTPDAALVDAGRMVAIDHRAGHTYLLALAGEGEEAEAEGWLRQAERRLEVLEPLPDPEPSSGELSELELERSRSGYLEDVESCRRRLVAGESYEVCLTNRARGAALADPFAAYRRLRRLNPAPHAAFLRFGEVAVLSSSPERFLRVAPDGEVEARPIKGTRRRGRSSEEDARLAAELRSEAKFRAENVTIVDLLRNDLGKVCRYGSVSAEALFEVESYATVHQLVSTVRGRLRPGFGAGDCIRACFPPGSMTGAPKRRTMEIIDGLERSARGVYSGAIGYLGRGGGADLSVAIRTIVGDGGGTSVGAGGAIVLDSNAAEEYEEMVLKLRAPAEALGAPLRGDSAPLPRALA
jgi:para-aminobenzoate synthetase